MPQVSFGNPLPILPSRTADLPHTDRVRNQGNARDMRKLLFPFILALAPAVSALAADDSPRINDPALPRTDASFLHDAATMTYWHYMSILCPFEKSDVQDLDLFAMVMFMSDEAPRLTTEQQAKLDRDADELQFLHQPTGSPR